MWLMQNKQKMSEWIADFLAADPPRSKSLLTTIFGDAIVPHGGTAWMGSLIDLLAPFGVNDRLLRTSVFRLAQEGWLGAQRDGRRSAYAITPEAMQRFSRAYRRVYAPLHNDWDGQWTLVLGSSGLDAAERGALRKELLWEGYCLIAPGIAGHPAGDGEALQALLERCGLQNKVFVCKAAEAPGMKARPLGELVAEGWDLSGVVDGYRQFLVHFAPLLDLIEDGLKMTAEQAFVARTLLIHAYRRVQLHDPHLPVALLPEPWPGAAAYELARALYRALYREAEEHLMRALHREDASAPEADAAFYQRFGGLD